MKKGKNLPKKNQANDSDSSDFDSADEQDVIQPKNAKQLEAAYAENPYSLEIAQKLLKLYSDNSETEKLAKLRRSLLATFTLPESLWLDWLDDEIVAAKSDEEKRNVQQLFQTALDDLLYIDVAKLYSKYAEGLHNNGVLKKNAVKIVYEKLLLYFAADFDRAGKFFKRYRKFELNSPDPNPENSSKTIRSLFTRQLKIPHLDLDFAWESYGKWEQDQTQIPKMKEIFSKSYEEMTKYLDLESKFNEFLEGEDVNKLDQFLKELALNADFPVEKKTNLFERSVEKHLASQQIWMTYTNFYIENVKNFIQQEKVIKRAVKNCYWDVNLAVQYLRVLEKLHKEPSQIEQEAFQLMKGLSSTVDYYLIWLFLVEVYTRALNNKLREEHHDQEKAKKEVIQFRSTMQRAIEFFTGDIPSENSVYLDNLELFWGNIETYLLQGKKELNNVMERYIRRNGGSQAAWLNYISLEMVVGNVASARTLLKRAVEYTKDNLIGMLNYAIEFERKYGTLEDLEHFESKLRQKNNQIKLEEHKMEVESEKEAQTTNRRGQKRNYEEYKKGREYNDGSVQEKKMKPNVSEYDPEDKQMFADMRSTVYIKNFPVEFSEGDVKSLFANFDEIKSIRLVKDKQGNSKGFAYVDFVSEEAAIVGTEVNGTRVDDSKIYAALSDPPKKGKSDKRTLFLNNLPFTITKAGIEQAFESFKSNIKEIRIITNDSGAPKGFAYVTFDTQEKATEAMEAKKKLAIDGRRIIIKEAHSTETYEKKFQNNVIFVKNITFKADEEELTKFFQEKNIKVKKVQLVRDHQTNRSKGFAYIELEDHHDLSNALHLEAPQLRNRVLDISKSDRDITSAKHEEHHQQHQHQDQQPHNHYQAPGGAADALVPIQRKKGGQKRNSSNSLADAVREAKREEQAHKVQAEGPAETSVSKSEQPSESNNEKPKEEKKGNDFFKNMFK